VQSGKGYAICLIASSPTHHLGLQGRNPRNQRNHCSATVSRLFDSIDPKRTGLCRPLPATPHRPLMSYRYFLLIVSSAATSFVHALSILWSSRRASLVRSEMRKPQPRQATCE
jgi:hypothetical protein